MKITATYTDTNQPGHKKYPWVGIGNQGHIVLFHAFGCGIMLRAPMGPHSAMSEPIGHYASCWNEPNFKPWTGKIELIITGA